MDEHDEPDPFIALQDWGKAAERRVRREQRLGGLRRKALFVAGAVTVSLFLVVVTVTVARSWHPFGASASAGDANGAVHPTGTVPAGVSVTTSAKAAPTDPFAGTPAATYPKGAAGISLPPPKAVTGFTAAQVAAALRRVRAALVAGRLSHGMLVDHDPGPFLALLAPNERGPIGKWFKSTSFDSVATWIAPAVTLDPAEQPRVSGRVTYASARVDGIQTLQVTTNVVWVYAFTGVDHPLAVEHDEIRWEFPATRNLRAGDRGMWIASAKAYSAWVDCVAAARGMLAPTRSDGAATPNPRNTEDPNAYLKADHSIEIADDCRRPS